MTKELIQVRGLTKIYPDGGTVGLDKVDLNIREGEFVAIIGPSGSGKSTLLQLLGMLDRPTAGKYFFEGKEIQDYSDDELANIRNRKLGFVFQAFNLLPRLSVLENIKLPLAYAGVPEPQRTAIAEDMITMVGLQDRKDFDVTKLSGGQKQRVAIARALVNKPKIIFADEPTGSLDSKSGANILNFLVQLHDHGHTVVLVTHETYVANTAERILHIKDGMIAHDEAVTERRRVSEDSLIK